MLLNNAEELGEAVRNLLRYFAVRDFTSKEACAVMGCAIASLIEDETAYRSFLETFELSLRKKFPDE